MTTTDAILSHLKSLPEPVRYEVLDFVVFLETRSQRMCVRDEEAGWPEFSLASAMRGMEDEADLYSPADIKEQDSDGPRGCCSRADGCRVRADRRRVGSGRWEE